MFGSFVEIGFQHIADINAYDHILFIIALCAVYQVKQWRQILLLVTAFTIGHSITLALSALQIIIFPSNIIEFLIPVTILFTALFNLVRPNDEHQKVNFDYLLAVLFGFIHGMGFSNYFRQLLGKEENIVEPLLAFNIGIEIGQLLIVAVLMVLSYLTLSILKLPYKWWNYSVSGSVALLSIWLMWEAKFW